MLNFTGSKEEDSHTVTLCVQRWHAYCQLNKCNISGRIRLQHAIVCPVWTNTLYNVLFDSTWKCSFIFFKETTILMCWALCHWDYLDYCGLFFFLQVKAAAFFKYVRVESQQHRNEMLKKSSHPLRPASKQGLCLGPWKIGREKECCVVWRGTHGPEMQRAYSLIFLLYCNIASLLQSLGLSDTTEHCTRRLSNFASEGSFTCCFCLHSSFLSVFLWACIFIIVLCSYLAQVLKRP